VEQIRGHTLIVGLGTQKLIGIMQMMMLSKWKKWQTLPTTMMTMMRQTLVWFGILNTCVKPFNKAPLFVRSSDTDVLVIMLTRAHDLPAQLWLDVGVSASNTKRYVDVSKLAQAMGPKLCGAIAGLHAFTGYDYNPIFLCKGKVCPLALIEKNQKFKMASSNFAAAVNRLGVIRL
jgi:hypothetical protein